MLALQASPVVKAAEERHPSSEGVNHHPAVLHPLARVRSEDEPRIKIVFTQAVLSSLNGSPRGDHEVPLKQQGELHGQAAEIQC